MEHQYHAQRFRYLADGRKIGTVPVGTILYLPDGVEPFERPSFPMLREPWQVEAWLPGQIFTVKSRPRRMEVRRCAGGHLALVRSLRTGERKTVADWLLLISVDEGWTRE